MNKKQREIIFNKYGGKCSYCGCELAGTRWHSDHAEPVERKYAWEGGGMFVKGTDIPYEEKHFTEGKEYESRKNKLVQKGFHKPENDTIENQMPACASCNINKHSMNIEEFRAFIGRFINSLNKNSVQYIVAKRYGLITETGFPVVFYFEKYEKAKIE